jgi:hypothetical protein
MSGKWKWLVLGIVVIAGAVGVYLGRPIVHAAGAATEYVARRACLCVYASGRSLPACIVEMPEQVSSVEAELLPEERAVRARISFIAVRTARYREGSGCPLD